MSGSGNRSVVDGLTRRLLLLLLGVLAASEGLRRAVTGPSANPRDERRQALADGGAAQVFGTGDTADVEQFRRWARATARDRAVLSVVLVGPDGAVLDQWPAGAATLAQAAREAATGQRRAYSSVALSGRRVRVAAAVGCAADRARPNGPLPAVVILAASESPAGGAGRAWVSILIELALAAVAVWAASFWLGRRIGRPLAALTNADPSCLKEEFPQLADPRRDEFAQIAARLHGLWAELDDTRTQTGRLERTLDQRVADQTRDIHAALRRTERQVWQDALTGLGNRRMLDDKLEDLFQAQQTARADLAVVMFDLDNFKSYNDTRGHTAGDELIRFAGELLRGSLRSGDIGIRYGGDEFAVLLPGVELHSAIALAERIVRLFEQRTALLNTDPRVTMSAGVASLFSGRSTSGKQLVEQADRVLYTAKRGGKNRAVGLMSARAPRREVCAAS